MRKERGWLLVELLVALMILEIVFVIAMPSAIQMQRYTKGSEAKAQVQRVLAAEAALQVCTANNQPCGLVGAVIPQIGTMRMGGYVFTFQVGTGWSYSAVPVDSQNPLSYYVDQTGILRFGTTAGVAANSTSPASQ